MSQYPQMGTEQECLEFSVGTDAEIDVWWYHGTTQAVADQFLRGKCALDPKRKFSLTTDPNGASQNALADAVIRARVKANRPSPDWYSTEDNDGNKLVGTDHMGKSHLWLHIRDATRIMVDKDYCGKICKPGTLDR